MVNVLIADDNVNYAINLMNFINKNNNYIRVCAIAKDGMEAINDIRNNKIDVILLDLIMPKYDGYRVLRYIEDKIQYKSSCIILSGYIDNINRFINNKCIFSVLSKTIGRERILDKINELVINKEENRKRTNLRKKIFAELQVLGYNISHKGTKYLLDVIEFIMLEEQEINSLEKNIYPILSNKYQESVHNIKCSINRATTSMYCECEIRTLKEYFYFYEDRKPRVKTIIEAIINRINHN